MGKRRLVKSEDGSYGIYDSVSKNVIEIPAGAKVVKSEDGEYGIFSNGKVDALDSFGLDSLKKKENTGLSGETSSTAGSSEGGNPRQIFGLSYADWGKKYGKIGEFAADIVDVPVFFKNEIYKGVLNGAIRDEITTANAVGNKPDFDRIASLRKDINSISLPSSVQRRLDSQDDPITSATKTVAGTIVNSLASSVGAYKSGAAGVLPGAATGAAIGNIFAEFTAPLGAVAGYQSAASYANEFGGSVIEAMEEKGYDLTNPKELSKAWADKDLMEAAKQKGLERGLTIGAIDFMTAGLASKAGVGAVKAAEKMAVKYGKELTEAGAKKVTAAAITGTEAISGSVGEATAQLVSEGKVSDWDAVAMESIAEIGSSAASSSYSYYKAAQINQAANKDNSNKIQSLHTVLEQLPADDPSVEVINTKIKNLKEENDNRNAILVEKLDAAPVPVTKQILELTNQIEDVEQKLDIMKTSNDVSEEATQQKRAIQDLYSGLVSERDSLVNELETAKKSEAIIVGEPTIPSVLPPKQIEATENAISAIDDFLGENKKAYTPVFNLEPGNNYTVSLAVNNKPVENSIVEFNKEEKSAQRNLDEQLDSDKITKEEYDNNIAGLYKQVITRGLEEKKASLFVKPETEVAQGELQAPTIEEFVYETAPEKKEEWIGDFEIIDNRNGKADLERQGANGNWYVKNNVTGRELMAKSKLEAQSIIDDADSYDFGQGETLTRPIEGIKVKEILEPLLNVENTSKALEKQFTDNPKEIGKINALNIINKAKNISDKNEYLNCDAFCTRLVNNKSFKSEFDDIPFKFESNENKVGQLENNLQEGDIIAFGEKDNVRHYATYIGGGKVIEVEEWGSKPREYTLEDNLKDYENVAHIYRDKKAATSLELSEAYHKSKEDGTNPELVSSVEAIVRESTPVKAEPTTEEPAATETAKEEAKPTEEKPKEEYVMDALYTNPREMIAYFAEKLKVEDAAKELGLIDKAIKSYRNINKVIVDNMFTRALSKIEATGFVGIRKIGDATIVKYNDKDKSGNTVEKEVSLNSLWKSAFGYTEDNIKKMMYAAQNSNNAAAKEVENSLSVLVKNISSTEEFQKARRELPGEKSNDANLIYKVSRNLNAMIGDDVKSLLRVHSLIDPEVFVDKVKEAKEFYPKTVEDLTVNELRLYNTLRTMNDFIHEWHYKNDFIDQYTYEKNKGKYFARAYKVIEDRQNEELYDAINKAGAGVDFSMFKQRKEYSEVNLESEDPIYITSKRLATISHNMAVMEFAEKVSKDESYKSYDKLSDVPEDVRKFYRKLEGFGSKKRFGPLTNKYVPIQIYEQLYGTTYVSDLMNDYINKGLNFYNRLWMRQWLSKSKTLYSPLTRLANITSGISFGLQGGVGPITMIKNRAAARKSLAEYDEDAQALTKAGLMGVSVATEDSKKSALKEDARFKEFREKINTIDDLVAKTYSKADDITKLSFYKGLVYDMGVSKEDAIKQTAEQMQNYNTVGKAWDAASKLPIFGDKFVKFKADSMRIMYNSLKNRPIYYLMNAALMQGLYKAFSKMSGESEEEKEARANRPNIPKSFLFDTGWLINGTEYNVARYLSPYSVYDKGYNGNTLSEISDWAPLHVQYLKKGEGIAGTGYSLQSPDPLLGPIAQYLADRAQNGMRISDPKASRYVSETLTPNQKAFNQAMYLSRSYGAPYAAWIQDINSAFKQEGDLYGRMRNPWGAALSIAIKNEDITPDVLVKKYENYLNTMSRDVQDIANNVKARNSAKNKEIFNIEERFRNGEISEESKNSQIEKAEKAYTDFYNYSETATVEIFDYAKQPQEILEKLNKLKKIK